jgi:hypothetical protein
MKTAMQELIDELERVRLMTNMNFVIRIATDLLEKEKEQIIEAVNYGNKQDHYDATEVELSNYYYNETFNQNK